MSTASPAATGVPESSDFDADARIDRVGQRRAPGAERNRGAADRLRVHRRRRTGTRSAGTMCRSGADGSRP